MTTDYQTEPVSKTALWAGRVISALPVLGLVMSAVMKFGQNKEVIEGFSHLGWPIKLAITLGILELTCTLLYAIPQTAVLGAILLTGYLGGAIATHVRLEEGFVPPVIMGVMIWLGLYLRDPRLRVLAPWRRLP